MLYLEQRQSEGEGASESFPEQKDLGVEWVGLILNSENIKEEK